MRCYECGERTETFPWFGPKDAADVELCEHCHPKCEVPGCQGLMVRGGEGGCEAHELEFTEAAYNPISLKEYPHAESIRSCRRT